MYSYLRLFQKTAENAVCEHLGNKDTNPFVVLPTGTGKSVVLAQIAAAFLVRAKSDWSDFRWLRFQVATLKSSCIGLFARTLKIHPLRFIEIPLVIQETMS